MQQTLAQLKVEENLNITNRAKLSESFFIPNPNAQEKTNNEDDIFDLPSDPHSLIEGFYTSKFP
jgi:hypothetical protein